MTRNIVLLGGLTILTLGMAILFIGVVSPGLFYAGIYLIAAGMLITAIAGVLHLLGPERT